MVLFMKKPPQCIVVVRADFTIYFTTESMEMQPMCEKRETPHFHKKIVGAKRTLLRHGAVGGIRTLEPLSGYTISSRARYDHFDTTAFVVLS